MCGIGGIVRWSGGVEREEHRLRRVAARLRHRGPDGEGVHLSPTCGLVHTRLALVDPAGGAQPMTSADGRFTLVYNGEIYDAAALRDELSADWTFRTRSDAEVVLAAYARWGSACVTRFNGMFAFFVWDAREEKGFAARDLLGVKPFVFARRGEMFVFASEAKAVLAAMDGGPRARSEALLEYLVAPFFSGVETPMFEGLEYLAPGHALDLDREGVRVARWARYELADRDETVSPAELRDAFERAVRRALVADAPVGVFLSGGLDSTAIAAAARRAGAEPAAFTIAHTDHERWDYRRSRIVVSDDEPFAALAAHTLGIEREKVPAPRADLATDLAAIASANDALPAWEQEVAQHRLAAAARRTCKAVLVGDAADETHYGYHFLLDPEATRSPRAIIERLGAPIVRRDVLADPAAHFAAKYRALTEDAGHDWASPAARVLATTWLVVHRWLPRLLHNGDIHGMAHSIEARVPFADVDLLALAQRIGPRTALRDGIEKAALREALRGLVPGPIRTRRKSALPKDLGAAPTWQREAARALDEDASSLGTLVDVAQARALCDPRRSLDEREQALLFRIAGLARWMRTFEVSLP
jgi:asparagine synthase (glutamine-hydrolysing)